MSVLSIDKALVLRLVVAVLVVVAMWVMAKLFRRAISRFLRTRRLAEADPGAVTRFKMIARLGSATVYFLGIGLGLYMVDVSVFREVAVAMFASAGVLGVALAFASQTTAANLVSGLIIAFAQPLRLGDRVEVEQEQGTVEEIGLLYTSVRTWDNRRVLIPNQLLSSRVIRNYTVKDPRSPAVVIFRLGHAADLAWVRSMAIAEAQADPHCIADPLPSVDMTAIDDGGVTVRVVAWAADRAHAVDLTASLRERVAGKLIEAGVPMGGPPAPAPAAAVGSRPAAVSAAEPGSRPAP